MRVLVNSDTLSPLGGVELSTLQVSEQLAGRGHDCHLLYGKDGGLGPQWRSFVGSSRQVRGFTVEVRRPWRSVHHLPAAVRAAVAVRPDVIYLNRAEQLLWGAVASARTAAPLVCHLRHHPFSKPAVRAFRRAADHYIAVSEAIRDEWVRAGIPAQTVTVVPNGIDVDRYRSTGAAGRALARSQLGLAPDAVVVLHYGRLTAEKGIHTLLRAWRQFAVPSGSGILVLAGDIDDSVRTTLRAATTPGVVVLARRDDVTPLLQASDLVVVPSLWAEPFGRVIIEAMSAGVPVVASRVGGIPEILTGRFADHLVEPGDADALAAKITELSRWRTNQPDLGEAGRAHVRHHFALSRTVDQVEDVLQAAVAGRLPRPKASRWRPAHTRLPTAGRPTAGGPR